MKTRRHFLQSSDLRIIALPALESLGFRRFASAATPVTPPKRLVFLGFGWGITTEHVVSGHHADGRRTMTLPVGLKAAGAAQGGLLAWCRGFGTNTRNEGHWGSTMWLTGANRYRGGRADAFTTASRADQVAAAQLGMETRFASLQFNSSEIRRRQAGHGPGLSMAWDVSGKPVGGQNGPVEAFHRLFAKDTTPIEQQQAMLAQKRSVLDAVLDNAKSLQRGLAKNDNAKLDEYFQGIRDIETRLAKEEQWMERPATEGSASNPSLPGWLGNGTRGDQTHLRHHDCRHADRQHARDDLPPARGHAAHRHGHQSASARHEPLPHHPRRKARRLAAPRHRAERTARRIPRQTQGDEGSRRQRLFDNIALAYGSNIRTGHELDNCPTILTGGGAGLKLGHNIVAPKDTPLCNAWLTMLHGIGVEAERHGDSTGVLKEIVA
jgi:hypothetical protein